MKIALVAALLSITYLSTVKAGELDCRWNTIDAKPIMRIWSKDGEQVIKSEKIEFSSYIKRDQAIQICNDFFRDVNVSYGVYEFKVGNSLLGATFSVKGYGTFKDDGTLLSHTTEAIKKTRAEELKFVSDYVGQYIHSQLEKPAQ